MSKKSRRLARAANNRQSASINVMHQTSQATFTATSYHSILPPPEIIRAYDEISPGFAIRLLSMVEDQTAHRQKLEADTVASDIQRSRLGMKYGFIIAMSGLVIGGLVTVISGSQIAGSVIAGTPLAGIVTAFVTGTVSRRSEREEKNKLVKR